MLILDGAGWHDSQALVIPGNITLLALPPYSPELNPVERIWHYLRSHWLANSVFRSSGRHHGRLRDGVEPLRRRPRLGPLALRRRLGAGLARSVGVPVIEPWPAIESTLTSGNIRRSVLDRTFTWDNTLNYWITYQNPMGDGVITRQITSYATAAGLSIIKVDDGASLYDLPITDSMYVITSSTNDYRTFRVIANKEQKGFQYEITAVQHEPKKFDDIDQYQPLVPPGGTPYSSWPVASPRNLSLSVRTYTVAMVVQSDITLSWSPPASPNPADPPDTNDPRVIKYDISWSNPNVANSQWQWLTTTQSTSFTVVNVLAGNYKFAVRAVTPLANGPYAYVATSPTSPIRPAVLQFSQTK